MSPLKGLSYLALCSVMFVGGFVMRDLRQGKAPELGILSKSSSISKQTPTELFAGEYQRILQNYALNVDQDSLLYAGLEGSLRALGDPHTQFMEPVMAQEFEDSAMGRQSFGGVGARLMGDPMGVKVIQVFRGSPAFNAGIRSGDIITSVNGEDVAGMASDEIVDKIKGEIGTSVTLGVLRGPSNKRALTIKRAQIIPPSADGNLLEGSNIGYVLVTGFEAPTAGQFQQAIRDLEAQKVEGLVIDLRNNPGGLLTTAQDMLSLFLDYKTMVTMDSRRGLEETVMTNGGRERTFNYPITILMNEQSASAAEIFAGVLKDYGRATLVGQHSYGKASVQNVVRVAGGGSVKLTIAHYHLPSGTDMARKVDEDGRYLSGGLKPDIEVELGFGPRVSMGDPKTDDQLKKAMEIIRKKNPKAR